MLTVKVMSADGSERIYSGAIVGFNPSQQSISISDLDQNIILEKDDVAFVMNADGKTISHYKKCSKLK
ncbi:hypothetical protein [Pantoea agglomerans]|uniref:hypothetical protein n=1 Tax=Enterobacter agglomerans TaxID=549 RepID=UPI0013BB6D2B|nr:hypothetical protein [Pantoea agglomerans]NEG58200.1 hypothetical protein [Pantoea agglomerans]NEG99913.1 hypothetical protein [Pantoea agglomerans]NEH04124.1 hypothetical protein [Pantoea agglomerans]NEH14473.1 hypothetical protein [Pantoea agglomerans]